MWYTIDTIYKQAERGESMAEKRKDKKGRTLKDNEYQRNDGRYEYKYIIRGTRKSIYSWKLVPSDKVPTGKKDELSLREKEKELERDIQDGIDMASGNMTLNQLFACYMETKTDIRKNTRSNYKTLWENGVKRSKLGNMPINQIRQLDVKTFYAELAKGGAATSTVNLYHNMISPALELAVDSDILKKNPAKDARKGIGNKKSEREALSAEEQTKLLAFVEESKTYNVYHPMLSLAFATGLRVGELTGLTWKDVDKKKKALCIRHQLQYLNTDTETKFYMSPLKSDAGKREIPITNEIQKCLAAQKTMMLRTGRRSSAEVDGYSGFIFITKNGTPFATNAVNSFLKNIVDKYNREEKKNALAQHRDPELMPHISAHILRHTACTRMAEKGMDIKVLQYIMGHSNIGITMEVYNHTDKERIKYEMQRLEKTS